MRKVLTWLTGIVCFGLLLLILGQFTVQIFARHPTSRFIFVEDIPLPTAVPTQFVPNARDLPAHETPLTPGVAIPFDSFDFQALDPQTKLLFVAHTGPAPDSYHLVDHAFDVDKDSQVDGYVAVIDTTRDVLIGRVNIPQVAGMVAAPDLGLVFAADSNDNIVYAIDEHTLKTTAIPLADNEGPDAWNMTPTITKSLSLTP